MFTGIVTDIGRVRNPDQESPIREGLTRENPVRESPALVERERLLVIEPAAGRLPPIGSSISCSGVCLTVTDHWSGGLHDQRGFAARASPETLAVSTLAQWQTGTRVNLERSLRLGEELGGHLVQGHVDGVATITDLQVQRGDHLGLRCAIPAHLLRFCAVKGSVTLDGVSLTINQLDGENCVVNIVPYTLAHTTLGICKVGDRLNLETDMLARYLDRLRRDHHR